MGVHVDEAGGDRTARAVDRRPLGFHLGAHSHDAVPLDDDIS